MTESRRRHFLTYAFGILSKRGGGLLSAFLREARLSNDDVVFLTADSEAGRIGDVPVVPALKDQPLSSDDLKAVRRRWFSAGHFQLLHPDAYTEGHAPPDCLEAIYQADGNAAGPYDLQRLITFVEAHTPPAAVEKRLMDCFAPLLQQLPDGSVVNWQDFYFAGAILEHAEALRRRGCVQTFHLHEPVPGSLHLSSWGRSLLEALSRVDKVLLHTDLYTTILERQLRMLGLPVPKLERFDLGIDEEGIRRSLAEVDERGLSAWLRRARDLKPEQRQGLEEVERTFSTIPHRFVTVDRLDPIKGNAIVIDAIERFLDRRRALGESPEQLRQRYRFFMIHELWEEPTSTDDDMQWQYIRCIRTRYARLMQKYPGILWPMPSLQGEHKVVLPVVMRKAHGMTGGIQDGLNLAVMEDLVINEDEDTSAVIGDGAGFAIQSAAEGFGDGACFVRRSNVQAFADGLDQLVTLRDASPGRLRESKKPLIARIRARRARLADDGM